MPDPKLYPLHISSKNFHTLIRALFSPGSFTGLLFALQAGVDKDFGTKKAKYAVRHCSSVTKADMVLNHATPKLEGIDYSVIS